MRDSKKREELTRAQKAFYGARRAVRTDERAGQRGLPLKCQKEKLEESMENQVNYMWNEYELTLRDAAQLG